MADDGRSSNNPLATKNDPPLQRYTTIQELDPSNIGPPRSLSRNGHDVEYIVDAAARTAGQGMTQEISDAVGEFQEWLKVLEGPGMPSSKSMLQAINILCRLVFPCPLPDLTFHWDSSIREGEDPKEGLTCTWPNGIVQIVLDPTRLDNEGTTTFISRIIATLLHEMCHAYIMLFACHGDCDLPGCKDQTAALIGKSGHGKAWLRLACHVQVAMSRLLPNLQVQMSPLVHLIFEARQGNRLGNQDFAFLWEDFDMVNAWKVFESMPGMAWQELEDAYADKMVGTGGLMAWLMDQIYWADASRDVSGFPGWARQAFGSNLEGVLMPGDLMRSFC